MAKTPRATSSVMRGNFLEHVRLLPRLWENVPLKCTTSAQPATADPVARRAGGFSILNSNSSAAVSSPATGSVCWARMWTFRPGRTTHCCETAPPAAPAPAEELVMVASPSWFMWSERNSFLDLASAIQGSHDLVMFVHLND